MDLELQKDLARTFQELHRGEELLLIPNIWDGGSAIIFEKLGFKALATTSAGIAYSLGYPDGEKISIDDLVLRVSQITKRITIPLSVDFERGYSENPEEIKRNVVKLLESGAVGFNIEDGLPDGTLSDIESTVKKIEALIDVKKQSGIDFVINGRTCAYWNNIGSEEEKLMVSIERGNAYRKAGADCIFIPGALNEETVQKLVNNIDSPLNIILNGEFNDIHKIEMLGVKRVSVGSGPVRSTYKHLIKLGEGLSKHDFSEIMNHDFSYSKANDFFKE